MDFFAICEAVAVGIRVRCIGPEDRLLRIEQIISIHVGHRAHAVTTLEMPAIGAIWPSASATPRTNTYAAGRVGL